MTGHHAVRRRTVQANDVEFVVLEAGTGPLALCLHGFPDAAHTCRHLLPELAAAGFHVVAPFMPGYAPTAVPRDGNYSVGALAADAVALHEVMGGDEQAVLIGSDWGPKPPTVPQPSLPAAGAGWSPACTAAPMAASA